jgi:hypothetical protein
MEIALLVVLAGVAVIHLGPIVGLLSVARLEQLYGTPVVGPDLAVLLRHRALLFGLLGAFVVVSMIEPDLRWPAVIATLISDVGFAWLMRAHPGTSAELGRVLRADVVSLVLLVAALAILLAG